MIFADVDARNLIQKLRISVDVVATSEVSVSVTLDISKIWARDLDESELLVLEESFKGVAAVKLRTNRTIISLIGNADRSNEILQKTFGVLTRLDVNPEMISKVTKPSCWVQAGGWLAGYGSSLGR